MDFNIYFAMTDALGNMPPDGSEGFVDFSVFLQSRQDGIPNDDSILGTHRCTEEDRGQKLAV